MSEDDPIGSIAGLAQLLASGQASAVELTRHCLDRIGRFDRELHSFIDVAADNALAAARQADAERHAGARCGPLHGIPFAVKDVYDVAGTVTTGGSRAFRDNVAARDATAVARLRAAGAVCLGKLATHELTHGGVDPDLPWPPVRNPWARDHDSGGSSSGAGAAVAAGFCAFALGTDTGGSIRKPAGLCGIAGLKPSFGRVSRHGVLLNADTLDHCGPMARTARDCAAVLQAIAGFDPQDAISSREPVPDFAARLGRGVRGLRIGVVRQFGDDEVPLDTELRHAFETALGIFRGLGVVLRDTRLRSLAEYAEPKLNIQRPEFLANYGDEIRRRPDDFGAKLRRRMRGYEAIPAVDYVRAQRQRQDLTAHMRQVMETLDILVTAGVGPAPPLRQVIDRTDLNVPDNTLPFNLTGFPAISTGIGFSAGRLPLSMQIVGKPFDEARVLAAADAFEQATPWHRERPRL